MSTVMIQLRNVSRPLHARMKARAVASGMSLSEYIKSTMEQVVNRPTLAEFRAYMAQREPLAESIDWAAAVREERDAR